MATGAAAVGAFFKAYGGYVAAGTAVASGVASASAQHRAGREVEKRAGLEALAERRSTEEQAKRWEEENLRREAAARARAAASGVGGVSTEVYIAALEEAGREEINWLREVGASAYQSAVSSGESAVAQAQAGMWGSIGQAARTAGSAYGTTQQ